MKRGQKAIPIEEKEARGTVRADRDEGRMTLVVDNNGPVMPDYMIVGGENTELARRIWDELHPKVTALGIGECDSALFARYCCLEAATRAMLATGVLPRMANMTQLRQMEEMLRIAGPRSRIGNKTTEPVNPFRSNGSRNRA